jgi:hypothetical protein
MATQLIVSGAASSQKLFREWPLWNRYPKITHRLELTNVGSGAVSNEFIGRAITKQILTSDHQPVVIVIWTGINKLDVYVDRQELIDQVHGFDLRNFIVDIDANLVDNGEGYWASSTCRDNEIKEAYQKYFETRVNYNVRSLEAILNLQTLCQARNIPLFMFQQYDIFNIDYIGSNPNLKYLYDAIDWRNMVTTQSIDSMWQEWGMKEQDTVDVPQKWNQIPGPEFHKKFFKEYIVPILDRHFDRTKFDIDTL